MLSIRIFRLVVTLTAFLVGIVLSLSVSYLLRFDFQLGAEEIEQYARVLVPAIPIKLFAFYWLGLGAGWWRYASLADVLRIAQATVVASTGLVIFLYLVYQFQGVPRSVLILDMLGTFLYLTGICFLTRLIRENYITGFSNRSGSKTLIIGAGESAQTIVREVRKNPSIDLRLVGYIDDDPLKRNLKLQGVPVLGPIDSIAEIVSQEDIDQVIIAIPGATSREMRRIVTLCSGADVEFRTLPAMTDLLDGRVTIQQIREVNVEDLLGRRAASLDMNGLSDFLTGKKVLVTGAAGSIGSELCRQILKFEPSKLILFDCAESPLFFLERELSEFVHTKTIARIGDLRFRDELECVFKEESPQIVFHAAAYKHVPLMENSPRSAVQVNVLGSKNLTDIALQYDAEALVLISTDKAVNPTNVMGASKRIAEMYIQDQSEKSSTRFVTVRFGNVLDSAGSVVPIFKQQIKNGGPITVTHKDVTRFFMTIPEAAQLVLQASCMGKGGEIFILDMGEPVKITYLAEELVRLSGLKPHVDIEIEYVGLRPGEKLHEELFLPNEGIKSTQHSSIRVAMRDNIRVVGFRDKLNRLIQLPAGADPSKHLMLISELVPEYDPDGHRADESTESKSA